MANFIEKKTPYEFLVRWDEVGNIKGSHVAWLNTVYKDTEILSQTPLIESVEIANNTGYPLNDIIELIHIDALKEIDSLNLELTLQQQISENLIQEQNNLITIINNLTKENEDIKTELSKINSNK